MGTAPGSPTPGLTRRLWRPSRLYPGVDSVGATATTNSAVLVLGTGVPAVLLRVLTALSLLLVLATAATIELLLTALAGLIQDSAYNTNQVSKAKQDCKYCCTILVPEHPPRRSLG